MTTSNEHNNAPAVPQGWKLVPVEPTKEMIDAYCEANGRFQSARADWAAMLAATPAPAPAQEPAPTWSLREALQKAKDALSLALSDVDWRKDSPTQPVIHKAYNCARQALALPTAAPVGELDLPQLPDPTYIYHDAEQGEDDLFDFSESGAVDEGCPKCKRLYTADQMRAYARAAMSAGDAVDAQRLDFIEKSARCDPKMDGQHVWWPTSLNKALKGPTLRAAIDAAMRKGQL